jgi:hypothetical protein
MQRRTQTESCHEHLFIMAVGGQIMLEITAVIGPW